MRPGLSDLRNPTWSLLCPSHQLTMQPIVHAVSMSDWVSGVSRPTRHVVSHCREKSLQTIHCTVADKQFHNNQHAYKNINTYLNTRWPSKHTHKLRSQAGHTWQDGTARGVESESESLISRSISMVKNANDTSEIANIELGWIWVVWQCTLIDATHLSSLSGS